MRIETKDLYFVWFQSLFWCDETFFMVKFISTGSNLLDVLKLRKMLSPCKNESVAHWPKLWAFPGLAQVVGLLLWDFVYPMGISPSGCFSNSELQAVRELPLPFF